MTREKKPDVVTPSSWQAPKGDAHVEGTITEVICDSSPVKIVVSASNGPIDLIVQNPDRVELINAEGASAILPCGAQSRLVVIDYIAATREIMRIEYKGRVIMKR